MASSSPGMQPSSPAVAIHLPLWLRVYTIVFGLIWCGILLAVIVLTLAVGDSPSLGPLIIPALMLPFGIFMIFRQLRLQAVAEGDTMTVRNYRSSHTYTRSQILDFRTGSAITPFAKAIVIVPHEGDIVAIDATMKAPFMRQARNTDHLGDLNAWLTADNVGVPSWLSEE